MLALIAQLVLLVGVSTSFRLVDGASLPVLFQGRLVHTAAYTLCVEGRPEITVAREARDLETVVAHELAHALDCLDDGVINGSPLPVGAVLLDRNAHCTANPGEYYACWLVETAATAGPRGEVGAAASFSRR